MSNSLRKLTDFCLRTSRHQRQKCPGLTKWEQDLLRCHSSTRSEKPQEKNAAHRFVLPQVCQSAPLLMKKLPTRNETDLRGDFAIGDTQETTDPNLHRSFQFLCRTVPQTAGTPILNPSIFHIKYTTVQQIY